MGKAFGMKLARHKKIATSYTSCTFLCTEKKKKLCRQGGESLYYNMLGRGWFIATKTSVLLFWYIVLIWVYIFP
jgi:hypothetical protein